ncbi:hypothetical protein B0H11DRAFT_2270538 [Mycena galericulata]|nr:hypothetical protein B0H11DRAFT_2270538 [Mycena galericulata]
MLMSRCGFGFQSHTASPTSHVVAFEFSTKFYHVNEADVPWDTVEGLVTLPGWSGPLDVIDMAADDGGDSSYDEVPVDVFQCLAEPGLWLVKLLDPLTPASPPIGPAAESA